MARYEEEKKSESVLINISPTTFGMLKNVAIIEDRPLGYVARELMLRGMDRYMDDGRLREIDSSKAAKEAVFEGIRRAIPASDGNIEVVDTKHVKAPTAGTLGKTVAKKKKRTG